MLMGKLFLFTTAKRGAWFSHSQSRATSCQITAQTTQHNSAQGSTMGRFWLPQEDQAAAAPPGMNLANPALGAQGPAATSSSPALSKAVPALWYALHGLESLSPSPSLVRFSSMTTDCLGLPLHTSTGWPMSCCCCFTDWIVPALPALS